MSRVSEILKSMEMRQAYGMSPTQGLCDRSWSAEEWDEYQSRRNSPLRQSNKSEESSPKFTKLKGQFETFYHPTNRRAKPIKVEMYKGYLDGQSVEFAAYEPIDKNGKRYETYPF